MTPVSHGKPCAGNPHARFDEGASAPEDPRRKALLHKELSETRIWLKLIGESGYVEKTKLADLISESKELSRILSASVITAKKKIGG